MTHQPDILTRIHAPPRILIAAFPARGHMNPALALADSLALLGCHVTFLTTVFSLRQSGRSAGDGAASASGGGVTFVAFSDCCDDKGFPKNWGWEDFERFNSELRRVGSETLRELVRSGIEDGRKFNCLVYTLIMPWIADVAAEFDAPAAVLWVQSATVYVVLRRYFHGFRETIEDVFSDPSRRVLRFPGLDRIEFSAEDLPTILKPGGPPVIEHFREQFEAIDRDQRRARVLVNTFDCLESEALIALGPDGPSLISVGPLVKNSDDDDDDDDAINVIQKWLDEKPRGSVVFVSFGSVAKVSTAQREQVARGLAGLERPFLWVDREEIREEKLIGQHGMVVPWCSQVAVLRHVAVSCFVSHCGWNSTLESLACGVPVVAVPQSVDQTTNAKLVECVWKTGLRARPEKDDGVVDGDEIKRCLEAVIGDEEFARNAVKWRDLCREAAEEGGSSARNLSAFLAEVSTA